MPPYMRRNPNGPGYEFRRGVPADLRGAIGVREIKRVLSSNFGQAKLECHSLAVQTDLRFKTERARLRQLAEARAAAKTLDPLQFGKSLTVIDRVTPEVVEGFQAYWLHLVAQIDQEQRETGMDPEERDELAESHATAKELLKRAWAEGNPAAFIPVMHQTLALRGYRIHDDLWQTGDPIKRQWYTNDENTAVAAQEYADTLAAERGYDAEKAAMTAKKSSRSGRKGNVRQSGSGP